MVSVLNSGLSGLGSSPGGPGHCVVFFTLTVPLSTQVFKWVPAKFENAGGGGGGGRAPCDGLASYPGRSRNRLVA